MITSSNKYKYIQKWKQEHPEKVRANRKKWKQEHPEKMRESARKYIMRNPEKWKEYQRKYRKEHKEEFREYSREWYKKHSEEMRECLKKRSREWQKAHPEIKTSKYRIDHSVSELIRQALKGKKAGWRWEKLVGYTLEDLMKHLESQFEPWMSWDNYGKWEIDHIKPKSLFHYETPEDPEFKECWGLENLQPLEISTNRKKHNHYLLNKS